MKILIKLNNGWIIFCSHQSVKLIDDMSYYVSVELMYSQDQLKDECIIQLMNLCKILQNHYIIIDLYKLNILLN